MAWTAEQYEEKAWAALYAADEHRANGDLARAEQANRVYAWAVEEARKIRNAVPSEVQEQDDLFWEDVATGRRPLPGTRAEDWEAY